MAAEALLAGESEALTRRAIELALAGDRVALKLCIDRIYPKPRDAPITTNLPPINSAQDILEAIDIIFLMVSDGHLTPIEARTLSSIIADQGRAIERADLEKRIDALEQNA